MSGVWDDYVSVRLVKFGTGPQAVHTQVFSADDSVETKRSKIAADFGVDLVEVQDLIEDVNEMPLEVILEIIERELEDANFHSMFSLARDVSDDLSKTQPEAVVRSVILILGNHLFSQI